MRGALIALSLSLGLLLARLPSAAAAPVAEPAAEPESGLSAAPASGVPCATTATTLCLFSQEFAVTATFRTPQGTTGQGQAVQLTGDTGYFWFFNRANVEFVIKVIDGCPVNGRFWIFAGGLTNVRVDIQVTDVFVGGSKHYVNRLNTPFAPIQDTAFPEGCPISSARFKRGIADMGSASERLMQLRPVALGGRPELGGAAGGGTLLDELQKRVQAAERQRREVADLERELGVLNEKVRALEAGAAAAKIEPP